MYFRGRWHGWAGCCERYRGPSMIWHSHALRESHEPGRSDRRCGGRRTAQEKAAPATANEHPPAMRKRACQEKRARTQRRFSSLEPALQRHADAHAYCLVVAIILVAGRADTDESNELAAQIGAHAD